MFYNLLQQDTKSFAQANRYFILILSIYLWDNLNQSYQKLSKIKFKSGFGFFPNAKKLLFAIADKIEFPIIINFNFYPQILTN